MNLRRIAIAGLAVGMLFALPGVSMGDSFRIRAVGSSPADFKWDPNYRHIMKSDRIVWKNTTGSSHTVVAYKGPWSKDTTVPAGETTSKRFRRTGTYKYRCALQGHSSLASDGTCSGMCGTVHVTN